MSVLFARRGSETLMRHHEEHYDGSVDGLEYSKKAGEYTRDIQVAAASGPKGPLFGRGRLRPSGKAGVFDRSQKAPRRLVWGRYRQKGS